MGGGAEGTPFGRYRLVELLGRGGMGEVWRAYDPVIDRVVALKVLPASFAHDEVFQERFRREARAAAGLDEPHVVPIYDFGEIEGRLFVTMRLIKGRDLQALLEDGSLAPARAVSIIEQIASALHAAHQVGLVHRDVKPSNILVAKADFAYLIDFGIARAAGETGLTSTGATIGTWAYMAPERFKKGGVADARADIYALACVLHESLTGEPPFPADAIEQIAVAHMFEPPPHPSDLVAGVPAAMDEVIATGMAKDPGQRYATTEELAHAARIALSTPDRTTSAEPPSTQPVRPSTGSATTTGDQVVRPAGTAGTGSRRPAAQPPTQSGTQVDTRSQGCAHDGSASPAGEENAGLTESTEPPTRDQQAADVAYAPLAAAPTQLAPSGPTPPPPSEPGFTRTSRRTKAVVIVGAAAPIAAIAVGIAATIRHQASSQTQHPPSLETSQPSHWNSSPLTTAGASTAPQSWGPDQQMIVDAFPQLLPPTPDGKGFGDATCRAGTDRDSNNPLLSCGPGYNSSTASFRVQCTRSRQPIGSDSNPYGKIPMEKLVSTQNWTKPSGSGQISRYDDPYGWRKMFIRFDGARSFCSISADAGVSVIEAWWSSAPI